MRIEEKTVYVVDGKTFDSESAAKTHEENCIGRMVDDCLLKNILLGPKDRIRLLDNILTNRAALRELLS